MRQILSILLAACVAVPSVARAQSAEDKKEAARLFDEGVRVYNTGDYVKAAEAFRAALDRDPNQPGAWRWLGLVYRAQKKCKESIDAYRRYLQLQQDQSKVTRFTERVRNEIELCRRDLGYAPIPKDLPPGSGALAVVTNIEGAQISIDAIPRGATPIDPLPIAPGDHDLQVSKPCFLTVTQRVYIMASHVTDVRIEMAKDPAAPAEQCDEARRKAPVEVAKTGFIKLDTPAGTPSAVTIDGTPVALRPDGSFEATPGIHVVKVTTPDHEDWEKRVVVVRGETRPVFVKVRSTASRSRLRLLAWTSLGIAAAAGATGMYFGIKEADKFDEARDLHERERTRSTMNPTPYTSRTALDKIEDDASGSRTISMVSLGVALAALGGSVVLFSFERDDRMEGQAPPMATGAEPVPQASTRRNVARAEVEMSPLVLPGGGGLVFTGRAW